MGMIRKAIRSFFRAQQGWDTPEPHRVSGDPVPDPPVGSPFDPASQPVDLQQVRVWEGYVWDDGPQVKDESSVGKE